MSKVIDVFPNVMRGVIEQASANSNEEIVIPTGLAALRAQQFRQNKRTAMELLKFIIVSPEFEVLQRSLVSLSTVSSETARNLSERGCIYQFDQAIVGTAASGLAFTRRDQMFDLTAGGIGQLVCTDKLFIQWDTEGHSAAQKLYFQIYFRYVSISLQEFSDIKEGQITYE